ncbi:hypothetical protein [Thiopseudomonas denitrificans]|uniref:hypothetical protein n=1 Tax=Thiopseudomonas denitrificans TaxID=1501432 RepID=UPI0010620DC8|nr:hypothetical protein [Thiopseudomonas denitrificans]
MKKIAAWLQQNGWRLFIRVMEVHAGAAGRSAGATADSFPFTRANVAVYWPYACQKHVVQKPQEGIAP